MTEGEKLVWAAAYAARLNRYHDSHEQGAMQPEWEQLVAHLSFDWANKSVEAMRTHRESYHFRIEPKSNGYAKLLEMLDVVPATQYKCLACSVQVIVPDECAEEYELYEGKCPPCYEGERP